MSDTDEEEADVLPFSQQAQTLSLQLMVGHR